MRRNDGFNVYRTGDYAAKLPSAKIAVKRHGCGTLIAKNADSVKACAAATAAAGSLPLFAYNGDIGYCFACRSPEDQVAEADGFDIYRSSDFQISFEDIKPWTTAVRPLSVVEESGAARACGARAWLQLTHLSAGRGAAGFPAVLQRYRRKVELTRASAVMAVVVAAGLVYLRTAARPDVGPVHDRGRAWALL